MLGHPVQLSSATHTQTHATARPISTGTVQSPCRLYHTYPSFEYGQYARRISVHIRLPDTSATGHFGTETLRTRMRHFSTVPRHFCTKSVARDTSASNRRKVGTFWSLDPGQFRQDKAPPVIRLKVGAEMSCGRSVKLRHILPW